MSDKTIECIIPILHVRDMQVSIDYYESKLGFKKQWGDGNFACVARDGFSIYLAHDDQRQSGTWIWIGVEDIDAIYTQVKTNGATIRQEPINYSWAREVHVSKTQMVMCCVHRRRGPNEDEPFNDR